jgi:hypothetical protein
VAEHRSKAPNAIREEVQRIADLIAISPHIGSRSRATSLEGVRKIHTQRVHYDLYYRITGTPAYIEIVAFWSSFRGSAPPT